MIEAWTTKFIKKLVQKKFLITPLIVIMCLSIITWNNLKSNEDSVNMKQSNNLPADSGQKTTQQSNQALGMKTSAMQTAITPPNTQNKYLFKGSMGVVVDDYSNKKGTITALEKKLGISISTISFFKQFGDRVNKNISPADLDYVKKYNRKILIAWEPWNSTEQNNQETDYLKEIAEGKHDEYIRSFARDINKSGIATTIRFGHEMNGDWYPWGRRAEEYKIAYRHIFNIFRNEKASNTSFMWSVNISENPPDLDKFYPGDDYVDIIGIDGFNFGTTQDYGGWRSFSELFGPTYDYLSEKYDKPISIAETASTEHGGNKAEWISEMFKNLALSYPEIKEVIWFNIIKETDWRIESSKSSLSAFRSYLFK